MSTIDARTIAADPISQQRLQNAGFDYLVVDFDDEGSATAFLRAEERGFLDPEPANDVIAFLRRAGEGQRHIGVFDSAAGEGPIATVASWTTPLTVPGGEIPVWAISSVTVAATHRRRGIARNLLEGELRAAAAAGLALAGLTVSEATIYSRYGFGPAVPVARMQVDTRRAGWIGAQAPGRVDYLPPAELAAELAGVHERSRGQRAGQIGVDDARWERIAGVAPGVEKADRIRGVRYRDAEGGTRGVLVYSLDEIAGGFAAELNVRILAAETAEALRALWGFAIQHDLVAKITADLRPADDPLLWLVADQRAVLVQPHDHEWLRILDVPAALGARTYRAPLDLVLAVDDALGFAAGTWRLTVDETGAARVVPLVDASADVSLDVAALSTLYAGGVSALALHAAGRLDAEETIAARLDAAFRAARAPLLGLWY